MESSDFTGIGKDAVVRSTTSGLAASVDSGR